MRNTWLIFALAILLGAVGGFAQSSQPSFVVKDIIFEGLSEVAEGPVSDQLTFAIGDSITVDDVRESAQRIVNMGLFRDVNPVPEEHADGVVLRFELEETPVLQGIEISGNRTYQVSVDLINLKIPFFWEIIKTDRVVELLEQNNVRPYQIANINDIDKAIEAISRVYAEKGYTLFNIDRSQAINSIVRGDILRFPIIEYLVEDVRIEGLEGEYEVLAQNLVHFSNDEPILANDLFANVNKLNNSVFFMAADTSGENLQPIPGSKFDRIIMNFKMKPRELIDAPQQVASLDFVGNEAYTNARLHNHVSGWDSSEPLDNLGLLRVLQGVFDLYRQNGYTQMDFTVSDNDEGGLTVNISEGSVRDISVRLDAPGGYTQLSFSMDAEEPQIQFFREDDEGFFFEVDEPSTHTQVYVVRKALQLSPGDLFNANMIRDTVRTMLDLGYFDDVQVNTNVHHETNEVDLQFTVIEKQKLGDFKGALSLADSGLVGKLTLSEKNLFGTGQDISLEYDRGIIGPARTNWSLNYSAFGFFPLYKNFDVRLFQSFERPNFDEELNRSGGELSLTYPLNSTTDLTMGGRHENFEECLRDGVDCQPPGVTDSVKFGVINDTRDNPLFPMEGGRRLLQVEKAGGFSVGVEFTKIDGALIHHFYTFENQNISARVFAGWGDGMPNQEKYSFGGPGTVRGQILDRVDWLSFVNLEYRVKWLDQFSSALFTDWGMHNGQSLTGTVGIEARVSLPLVGMTRFILAWPVNDPGYKTFVPRFQFSFGTMF